MSVAVAAPILREDDRGIPRSLPLLAALVEAEARRYAATAASRPAEAGLVRTFRGGATPKVPIRAFLERIHLLTRSMPSTRGMIRIDGTCFVLGGIYLTRFVRSPAGREAGILVEPGTVHRLVAAAVFLGAKFGCHPPRRWTAVFEASSDGAIRAGEMPGLEDRFLRAIDFRLFVDSDGFDGFCKVLERGPRAPAPSGGGCACKKRQADAAAGEEDERRRVRARLPPPAVVSN
ncbi:cyclin-P3-1-like [Panicum miliaceum]|uniref:Cyclin-P3-1-like n=1 Tax=Panicum miliaceum TaxID=4540 RepID=A0A3L6RZ91_PANMI|nr:cyclin-P3-1-like [Panicum miliaceum]